MSNVKVIKEYETGVLFDNGMHFVYGVKTEMVYTNYRGVTESRIFVPESIWYGKTEFHPEQQQLLKATVLDRGEPVQRDFAVADFKAN